MSKKKPDRYKVLSVGKDSEHLNMIQRYLVDAGYDVLSCSSVEKAITALEFSAVNLVVSEMDMPVISGLELLRYVKENFIGIEMIITGFSDIDTAVKSIKEGAEEYLVWPFEKEDLVGAVERIREKQLRIQKAQSEQAVQETHGIIGQSDCIQRIFRLIEKAAKIVVNVLISGESGTGKELVARAIHYNSDRSRAPFVSVNCTTIPDTLLESELFGHVKGAFTGAKESRAGFFQIADGGTIFLDEIGDASLNMQGKLLRVLQNKEINLVGSSRIRKIDTRIIAATHKDLTAMAEKHLFREDLYYRLNVIDIPVPPLRDRGDDILLLVNHFVNKFATEMNRRPHRFTDNALQALRNYHWPGNVRELENLIQRLVVIVDGELIRVADMPPHMRYSVNIDSQRMDHRTLAQVEMDHITKVLRSVNDNKTKAAELLGVDRKTLRKKLQKQSKP